MSLNHFNKRIKKKDRKDQESTNAKVVLFILIVLVGFGCALLFFLQVAWCNFDHVCMAFS